ncbi:hypothetical protein ACE41B_30245 [Bacillus cereus]|uniref:hypothetical protein n=1 Tax=Bacillus cereus TaxID=1396 RepID=UPI0035CAAF53
MKLLTKLILFIFLFSTFTLELPVNAFAQEANKDSIKVIILTDEEIAKFKEELANRSENSMMDDSTKYSRTKRSAVAGAGALAAFVGETFWIPGIGQAVLITAAGVTIAGVTWYAGSWFYDKVAEYLTSSTAEKYEKAKKAGEKAVDHKDVHGVSLSRDGTPYSSQDLYHPEYGHKQRRYYDENGKADEDIDYTHGGADKLHTFPHRHKWDWTQPNPRSTESFTTILSGWLLEEGYWYYINGSLKITTGWHQEGGSWYYHNGYGEMQTGWQSINGSWYYLNSSGVMVTGQQTIDEVTYNFGSDGRYITE